MFLLLSYYYIGNTPKGKIYIYIILILIMAEITIKVKGYKCERCEHEWAPRNKKEKPIICPKCKSPYWNKPKKK